MGKVAAVAIRRDIGKAQNIQLLFTTTAGGIDWEQDGPSDAATDEHDSGRQLQESQQEISIQRVVLENVSVGELVHSR